MKMLILFFTNILCIEKVSYILMPQLLQLVLLPTQSSEEISSINEIDKQNS